MNFLIHDNLPTLENYIQGYGQVTFFSGRTPPASALRQTHVLLIRSGTAVNRDLLACAPQLKFVGTGTIGIEHVDVQALHERDIGFASAPGSNAIAVGEYVLAAVLELAAQAKTNLTGKLALVVGAGHTGEQAGQRLAALGMQVRYIDPAPVLPFQNKQQGDWSQLPEADVVSLHVPLTQGVDSQHATWHLMGAEKLAQLKPDAILINASRGAVVDNTALLARLQQGPKLYCALDVWEGEPSIKTELLAYVNLATAHIAGHSLEGKLRASYLLYQALHDYFKWPERRLSVDTFMPQRGIRHFSHCQPNQATFLNWVRASYAIQQDNQDFREQGLTAKGFDQLRKNYHHRRELSATQVQVPEIWQSVCQQLGFTVNKA